MLRISFKTQTGHYLIANDGSQSFGIRATADGVGSWEVFTIILASGRTSGRSPDSIRSGDLIYLQTHHGRYIMAHSGGGGIVTGEATLPNVWETFTIEKLTGTGEIVQDDLVTLRANNGRNLLMAHNGGGGDVTAESTNRSVWETFSVKFWNQMLVCLRSYDSHYLAAENGGGSTITATRNSANIWETFSLINRSRSSGMRDGDLICLQTWNGKFVSAESGGGGNLLANRNRAARFETFTIQKTGGGEIALTDRIFLRTSNETNFVMAFNGGGGTVNALASLGREWETFRLEAAEVNPIGFFTAPSTPPQTGHPIPSPIARVTGRHKLICFLIGFQDRPVDDSISQDDFRSFFFGERDSVRVWIRHMSGDAVFIRGDAFGPLTVPWPYVARSNQEYFSGLLDIAQSQGFVFRNMDTTRDGTVSGDELLFVILDCTNAVGAGQRGPTSFTYDGIRYSGTFLIVGLYTRGGPVQGRAQLENVMGTVTHELSHMLFDLPDRYYQIFPPRGDVIATSRSRGVLEKFEVIGGGGGDIRSGNQIRLRIQNDGDFMVSDGTDRMHLNRGGMATDPLGVFIIERQGGGESIGHGDRIHLKSRATNRYVMANLGGGHVVQVIARRPSVWETFTVERDVGAGTLRSGETMTLMTSNQNHFERGFYLRAEPAGRRTDPETLARGWWHGGWERSPAGGGAGGDFDIMDYDKDMGILSAYDRIKRGWIVPKVLTPDNRACYVLNPNTTGNREAFILWDPTYPDEWYVIENRQRRERVDDIPSSGLIISWINEKTDYWNRWGMGIEHSQQQYPAVISAAAPTAPPNSLIKLVMLSKEFYKRSDPNTAFRSGTHILPRGDGSMSRFKLSIRGRESFGGQVMFCIL